MRKDLPSFTSSADDAESLACSLFALALLALADPNDANDCSSEFGMRSKQLDLIGLYRWDILDRSIANAGLGFERGCSSARHKLSGFAQTLLENGGDRKQTMAIPGYLVTTEFTKKVWYIVSLGSQLVMTLLKITGYIQALHLV